MHCGDAQFFQDFVFGEWRAVHSTGQTSIEISDAIFISARSSAPTLSRL
jgi:hypothetical protein